jgi:hypothetical protein
MKSHVELTIDAPQSEVAALLADPRVSPHWMEDFGSYEPLVGEPGAPGSVYRLVSKDGKLDFTAKVVERQLPTKLQLFLDAPSVSVSIKDDFVKIARDKTKLISQEEFQFKGFFNKLFGFLSRPAIHRVHRRQMEAFKRFAEGTAGAEVH